MVLLSCSIIPGYVFVTTKAAGQRACVVENCAYVSTAPQRCASGVYTARIHPGCTPLYHCWSLLKPRDALYVCVYVCVCLRVQLRRKTRPEHTGCRAPCSCSGQGPLAAAAAGGAVRAKRAWGPRVPGPRGSRQPERTRAAQLRGASSGSAARAAYSQADRAHAGKAQRRDGVD